MKNIYIYGPGSFGEEVYHWLMDYLKEDNSYTFKGFVGSINLFNESSDVYQYYVGSEDEIIFTDNDYIIIAIAANIEYKNKIVEKLKKTKVKFFNLIHPSAIVKSKDSLGEGNIVSPYSIISYDVSIGNFNSVNCHVTIGHHATIGNFNTINSHCDITGYTNIGNDNFFGSSAIMLPKSIIGDHNKVAAGTVIYKRFRNNCTIVGNPAVKL